MKFPGYWVFVESQKVVLERTTFDDTELDPATDWQQAWQNQSGDAACKGYVALDAALAWAAKCLATTAGRSLSDADLKSITAFIPVWQADRCEINSISHLLGLTAA